MPLRYTAIVLAPIPTAVTDVFFVYCTTSSRDEALSIGRALVEQKFAACANVLDGMTSIYPWQGNLEQSDEAILILKTTGDCVEQVIGQVRQLHSYDCPCIVAWPMTTGHGPWLDWVAEQTTSPPGTGTPLD